jgi:asparagine synthase (glutamine-hydrolysing)
VAAEHARARAERLDPVTTMQLVDLRTWLPSDTLVKGDRMSMAHGVELRVPFLDREVLAAAAGLTPAEKVSPQTTKVALRSAVADLLPAEVVARPKLGFPVPIGRWLRGELFGFAERLFAETEADRYVQRDFALSLLRRHRAAKDITWRHLWVLVAFCLWHQVHVERRHDSAWT